MTLIFTISKILSIFMGFIMKTIKIMNHYFNLMKDNEKNTLNLNLI